MKVALYARVSSEKQDTDLSIAAQLKSLREYSARNGHEVVREFVDEAESGRTAARPAFKEMTSVARRSSKPFEAILVWKYSRFARSREDSIIYKALLRKHGVQVVSITEPFEDTPTGRLLEAMIESLDEFYSANLGQEIRRGMRESASRGFYMGSHTPYGYRRVRVKDGNKERPRLEPNPHEAPVVARIFKDVLEGKGLKEIAGALDREGIAAPRGKGWGKATLHKILTNEAHIGKLVWGRSSGDVRKSAPICVENAWPTIVDRETFNRVQALLKERAPVYLHPRRVASNYLLSGIARCGTCGKALIGQEAKGGRFAYYVCGTLLKKGAGTCDAPYLNSRKFEDVVLDKIRERILTDENLRELVRLVNEEMDASTGIYRERLDTIVEELAETKRRLDRLYDALETGRMSLDDLAPRIQALRQRQNQLQAARCEVEELLTDRRMQLADMAMVTRYVEDLRGLLSQGSLSEQKAFIRSFVKEVRVTGKEVLLIYTIPLPPDGAIHERAGGLSIVHDGGPNETFAKPTIETFFELSITPASSFERGQAYDHS